MGKVVRNFSWISYDNLGKLILANAVWFFLSFGGVLVAGALAGATGSSSVVKYGLVITLIALPSVTAGMSHFTALLVLKKDAAIAELFRGIRMYWGKATMLGAVAALGCAVLGVNIVFYARFIGADSFWLGAILGGITIWVFLFFTLILVYFPPLLVQKKAGVAGIIKLAALLTLDNLGLTFGLALSVLVILILTVSFGVGLLFLTAGLCGVLVNVGYAELVRRYERLEREKAGLEPLDEEDDYAGRGLRDILKPWEM